MTVAESKEFKVKDDDTKYYLSQYESGNYFVWWYDEEKIFREVDYPPETVVQHFDSGNWKFVGEDKSSIKSDGGSSPYYELTITNKAGESIKCETGDVIRALVGNDFDFGNCVKALRRMYLATLGMGKEGTDIPYDCNKVRYFLGEIERVNK